ncbi:MAG: type I restriction-modification enzyme R subunit C-terminal domain-containing protein, partial [Dehalococcoidia bacterium]
DYACRVTADEGQIGRGHLSRFQDVETVTPAILTTSQLLTTGVDVPTCTNVVLARVVGTMAEFKQIIGRGTRVRDDYGKLYFNILDYTGSATRLFADPDFDGFPAIVTEVEIDALGDEIPGSEDVIQPEESLVVAEGGGSYSADTPDLDDDEPQRRKYYWDGGRVEIVAHMVHELAPDGTQLRMVSFTDYTGEQVRTLYPTAAELRARWADPTERSAIIAALEERGIGFDELRTITRQPEADPFDLLCHLAYNAPLRTRRERAERLRQEKRDFFEQFGPEARAILEELLEKYAEYGAAQFSLPAILKVPPISGHGTVQEIAGLFGGSDRLRTAVHRLQALLYAA